MIFPRALFWVTLLSLLQFSFAGLVTHDGSFEPDVILRATSQLIPRDCQLRQSVVINGTSPGPELRIRGGDNMDSSVQRYARLESDYGELSMLAAFSSGRDADIGCSTGTDSPKVAPFSDGSPQASQWPIPPFHFFDYEVHPVVEEAGTYFYHSHVDFQAATCAGPLIVEDTEPPPFHYDEDRIVFLSEYFNMTDQNITDGLLANPFKWSGETNSLLVNGLSGTATNNSSSCAPAVFGVEPDKTYRFRFIGGTALSFMTPAFQNHTDLVIIEADGAYTRPFSTSYLQVATGQSSAFC